MRFIAMLAFIFASSVHAVIVARVVEANGNSFVFDSNGGSKRLGFGSRIHDMSDIMVEDSGSLSLLDSSGNLHHLAGGAYAKFFNQMLEVNNGRVWSEAKGEKAVLINTVNAVISSRHGQVIVTVDNSDLKTQALALTGSARLASAIEPQLSIDIPAGHFSFIDDAYKGGLPRTPTRVGLRSYQRMKLAFGSIKSIKDEGIERSFGAGKAPERKIASVAPKQARKGRVIYVKTNRARKPASVSKNLSPIDYYNSFKKKAVRKKRSPASSGLGKARVRIFGVEELKKASKEEKQTADKVTQKKESKKASRVPASVGGNIISDINSAFEKSLSKKVKTNRKHSSEVNQLIDELESFKRDYSKNY